MDLEEYKQEYLRYGGNEYLLENFTDIKKAKILTDIQQRIFSIRNSAGSRNPDITKQAFEEIDRLRSMDISMGWR